jgi:hypothetical protein
MDHVHEAVTVKSTCTLFGWIVMYWCTGYWWGSLRERGHWGDPDIDGRIILSLILLTTTIVAPPSNATKWQMGFNSVFKGLRWIFRNLEGVVGIGWSWLRIGIGGGHF